MKSLSLRLFPLSAFIYLLIYGALNLRAQSPSEAGDRTPAPGCRLVWEDDFSKDPDGLPDPAKWAYEKGFVRNHEAQYYTERRLENVRVEKGLLVIEARKESFSNALEKGPRTAKYTSGSITTRNKASWKYGRIEVCAKMPAGQGVWPAIWTLGANGQKVGWPRCGEIDILEMWGSKPDLVRGTFHYSMNGKHTASLQQSKVVPGSSASFHIYAADWTADRIDLLVDNVKYASFDVSKASEAGYNPYREPQYLILNLALGGTMGGKIDDSIFPQRMVVKYVRVYQTLPNAGH